MNKAGWDGLTKTQQTIIRASCDANVTWTFIRSEAKQFGAMAKLKAKGVTNVRWSEADLDILRKTWLEDSCRGIRQGSLVQGSRCELFGFPFQVQDLERHGLSQMISGLDHVGS